MKFNKSGQLLLVSAVSLLAAALVTACSSSLTVDFVFVTSSKAAGPNSYGEIDVYEINSESGFMRQIPTSPFPSGGRNPVAEAVSADSTNLYVVNQDDNTIVQFVIGNDGKVYPQNTVNTPGIFPLAAAVGGPNLFVLDSYQPLPNCSPASPCSGSIAVYPVLTLAQAQALTPSQPADTLGTPLANGNLNYWPLALTATNAKDVILPTGVTVLKSGTELFVSAYDTTAKTGYVFGFSVSPASAGIPQGTLTPLNNGLPFAAGTQPSAIASDPTSSFVYVTDQAASTVLGFSVSGSGLTPIAGSPFPAGNQPSAILVNPTGGYAYLTDAEDGNVSAYSIASNGALTRIGSFATGTQPVAIGIDPNMHQFLYTANFLGSDVSGFEINSDGSLLGSQSSPYPSNAQPTAVVAIPHNGSTK